LLTLLPSRTAKLFGGDFPWVAARHAYYIQSARVLSMLGELKPFE